MHNNEIRRKITALLTFFDRSLPVIFWILVVFGFGDITTATLTVIAALIHEFGHVAFIFVRDGRFSFPKGALNGLRLSSGGTLSYREEIGLYSSGPIANLAASVLALPFFGKCSGYAEAFALLNLTTALTNLIPIEGYDGYGILFSAFSMRRGEQKLTEALRSVSSLLTVLLCFTSLYLMYVFGTGYWIYAVFFLSVYSCVKRGLKSHFFEF